jgi:ATP-dependent Clp protease ATP-binding subunit ClpC
VPNNIDLPLSPECQKVLRNAVEEADILKHPMIGPEHLLLGLLREHNSLGAEILRGYGLNEAAVRKEFVSGPMLDDADPF